MSHRLLHRPLPSVLLAVVGLCSLGGVSALAAGQRQTDPAPTSGPYQVLLPNGLGSMEEAVKRGVGITVACLDPSGKAASCTVSAKVTVNRAEANVLGLPSTVIASGKALTPLASKTPFRIYDIPLTHPSRFRTVANLGVTVTGTVTTPDGKKTKIPEIVTGLSLKSGAGTCLSKAPGLLFKAHKKKPVCPTATNGIAGPDW